MLLPQDLYILLKLSCIKGDWNFRSLSAELFISVSQIHLGLKRAALAGLYSAKQRKPNRPALEEFVIHGVKFVYFVEQGSLIYGIPTSYAGPPLNKVIVQSGGPQPVWPYPEGKTLGYAIEPLHPAAPKAALIDQEFYELLCLVDGLRDGRARERQIAATEIHNRLRKKNG